jgi:hypothetical protein
MLCGQVTTTQEVTVTTPQQAPPQLPEPPPARPDPYVITPRPGDRLDDLLSRLDAADAALAQAKSYRDTIDAALKLHLTSMIPRDGQGRLTTGAVDIPASATRKARRLGWGAKRTFDKDRFVQVHGQAAYDSWLKFGKGFWGWRDVK